MFSRFSLPQLARLFGGLLILVATIMIATHVFGVLSREGLIQVMIMQSAIGFFMFYAASQRMNNTELSAKLYPASFAALILYGAYVFRWLTMS